ncbi:MAG: hypothetical protein H7841_14485 [Magnetospirillum sp. WYHS-4]
MNLIVVLVAALLLLLLHLKAWQPLCNYWARQRLFEVRGRLFDMAATGQLSFDDPAYRELREGINVLIRFAHHITWPRIAWCSILLPSSRKSPVLFEPALINLNTTSSNPNTRLEVRRMIWKAEKTVVFLVLLRSPSLWLLVVLGMLAQLVAPHLRNMFQKAVRFFALKIERDAGIYNGMVME